MSFEKFFYGAANGEERGEKIDKTKPLILVSKQESLHEMIKNLSFDEEDGSIELKRTIRLNCDEINYSSDTVQNHLGFGGMMSKFKKVAVTLEKEENSISVCVKRRQNRIVFAYNQDTQGLISSVQTKAGKSSEGGSWKHLGVLSNRHDDLYSIILAVENYDLINGSGSL
jgi:hypothetical protein